MDDSGGVRGGKRIGNLNHNIQNFAEADFIVLEMFPKRFAFDKFGGNIVCVVNIADFVNRQNIRMIQGGSRPRFLKKSTQMV